MVKIVCKYQCKNMKEKFDKYWGLWHTNGKENDKGQELEQERDKGRSRGRGRTRRTSIY
jgi:hypothetical protein